MAQMTTTQRMKDKGLKLIRRFWISGLRQHKASLGGSFVCMGISALGTALLAHSVKPLFDDIFSGQHPERLWSLAALIMGVFLMKGGGGYGQMVLLNSVSQRVVARLQKRVFDHLIDADLELFQVRSSGTLISLLTYDIQVLRTGMTHLILNMGRDVLSLVFLVGVMVREDLFLALMACVGFPLIIWPIRSFGRKMRKIYAGSQGAMGNIHVFFQQAFQGIRLIKAYGLETLEKDRAGQVIGSFLSLSLKGTRIRAALHPLMEVLAGVAIVVVIIYGGHQVMAHARTTGSFLSFMTALLLAYEPVKKLVHMNTELQEGLSALSRLFGALDTQRKVYDHPQARPLQVTQGQIDVRQVTFAYPHSQPLFKNVSLTLKGGEKVAVVGPSGGGKSTLLNLLLRFYDPQEGEIVVDGQPLTEVTLKSLHQAVAFVGQEVTLFDETVFQNIAYGRPGALREDVESAARAAGAHEFVMELAQGYDTLVGESGLKLSGGQRQRLAIARAMLKDAPILLLDEATSSLDTVSEHLVQQALERLMVGRTTVTIAHRLSTVEKADRIFVMVRGAIVAVGTHQELLAEGGVYARLVVPQLEGMDAESRSTENLGTSPDGETP